MNEKASCGAEVKRLRARVRALEAKEDREAHLKQVLLAIRNVNQLITTESDAGRLIERACATLIQTLGYHNAWIALTDETNTVTRTAHAGFDGGFAIMQQRLKQGRFPGCMRRTLGRDQLVVIQEPSLECTDCPLAREYAGRAGMTRSLGYEGRIYGLISVSVPRAYAYDAEAQGLFEELSADLGFALYKIGAEARIHLFNHIVATLPHPIAFVSPEYRYLAVNDAYSRLYAIAPAAIVGHTVADFFGQSVFESDIQPRLDRCLSGQPLRYEIQADFPGAGHRWMEMEYFPYWDESGAIAGVVSHGLDITERKRSETERERLNADLAAKNAELEQVVYVASHDLRSPLVNIDGYSRELEYLLADLRQALSGPDQQAALAPAAPIIDQEIPEAIRFIRTSASKMDKLLTGLLRLSRSGRAALNIGFLDMNELMARVLDSVEFLLKEAGVQPELGDLPPCCSDAVQVNQVFSNLLDNALKYLDPHRPGRIRISGEVQGDQSVYWIEDNGIGMDPGHLEKIFEIFHRLDPGYGKGEGLGLTIVKRILDRLGGAIRVESRPKAGSCFQVFLPKAE